MNPTMLFGLKKKFEEGKLTEKDMQDISNRVAKIKVVVDEIYA